MSYITNTQISKMTYNQLGKALTSGELTEQRIRSAYSELRKLAMSRNRRVSAESVTQKFGNETEYFRTNKNLVTTSQLLHELADVNKYLHGYRSTITGLKKHRQNVMDSAEKLGFDIDASNYPDFVRFMNWFKSSEYSKLYDSSSIEVSEVFNSERASRSSWERAFQLFARGSANANT